MKRVYIFDKDLRGAFEKFPKLKIGKTLPNSHILEGDLDICDNNGNFWGTFKILILVPKEYPYCVPIVIEKSKRIPREADRHISSDGICCLDIDHRLKYLSQRGINISDFIALKVYPYFANQLFYERHGKYASEEFKHGFEGIRQFYSEHLKIDTSEMASKILKAIIDNEIPVRNIKCVCGAAKKYKKCHLEAVEYLQRLGRSYLEKDLESFSSA